MHDIEPHFKWRDEYIAAEDEQSPFHGRIYDEFTYTQKIYNYFIHPQWDDFGSQTLYMKILFVDYDEGYAILEFIGEWNDALHNDIRFLKREIIDSMVSQDIYKFIIIAENVLNFHGDDNCYYEEWYDDIKDEGGWITFVNIHDHVEEEMKDTQIQYYANFGKYFNDVNWRPHKPKHVFKAVEALVHGDVKRLV
jgi:hypothetical protein